MVAIAFLAIALATSSAFAAPIKPSPVNNKADDALTQAVREAIIKTRALDARSPGRAGDITNGLNALGHPDLEPEARSPTFGGDLEDKVSVTVPDLEARSTLRDLELIPPPGLIGFERVHPREPGLADEVRHGLHDALPNLPRRDLEARSPDELSDDLNAIGRRDLDLEARTPGLAAELRHGFHAFPPSLPRRDLELELEARADINDFSLTPTPGIGFKRDVGSDELD